MNKLIYDIQTAKRAQETLSTLTGISFQDWRDHYCSMPAKICMEKHISSFIQDSISLPDSYENFEFAFIHITTSANECESFKQRGILDLQQAYSLENSELRKFLDEQEVYINIKHRTLTYKKRIYSIYFGTPPINTDSPEYKAWSIGRKIYYDFSICGFLSIYESIPYLGDNHTRPEILMDIDKLLGLQLSDLWGATHVPYQISARVSGKSINLDCESKGSSEIILSLLSKALMAACESPTEEILILNNGIQIPPSDIVEISPFSAWSSGY